MTKLKAETGEIRSLHQLNASLNESRRRALFRLEYGSRFEEGIRAILGAWSMERAGGCDGTQNWIP